MPINFPTSLDTLTNPVGTDDVSVVPHAEQHATANDILEALETKVGINGSADTNSLDYKLTQKAALSHTHAQADVTNLVSDLSNKQPLDTQLTSLAGLSYTGNALKVARVNAGETDFELATVSGGQTLYECVVASSGGDYTSVSAAITAGKTRIFVRNGTYTEAGVTNSTAGITVVGESPAGAILSLGSNSFTLNGTENHFENLYFSTTTGSVNANGTFTRFVKCDIVSTGTSNNICSIQGSNGVVENCNIVDNAVSAISGVSTRVALNGSYMRISNTYIKSRYGSSQAIMTGYNCKFNNNRVEEHTAVAGRTLLKFGYGGSTGTGNEIQGVSTLSAVLVSVEEDGVFVGNRVQNGAEGIRAISPNCVVSNNLVYQTTSGTKKGIRVYSSQSTITNNTIRGYSTASNQSGIYVEDGADQNTITGNQIDNYNYGIEFAGSGANYNTLSANSFSNIGTKAIFNAYQDNVMQANIGEKLDVVQSSEIFHMKNTSGGALAIGDTVILKSVAAGDEVTTTTTAGDDNVFGMMLTAPANNAYGYVLRKGKTVSLKVNGTTDIAIGDLLTTYTTAGIAAKATAGDMVFAKALEAYTTDDSAGVIDALLIEPRLI